MFHNDNQVLFQNYNSLYKKVTGIREKKGYFVQIGTMNNGIDVLCKYVACAEMPNVGDTVNVKLTMVNSETGRAAGEILEIKNKALLVA